MFFTRKGFNHDSGTNETFENRLKIGKKNKSFTWVPRTQICSEGGVCSEKVKSFSL